MSYVLLYKAKNSFFLQERALVLYPELVNPGGDLRLRGGGRQDRKVTWF